MGREKSKNLAKVTVQDIRKIIAKNFEISIESLNETYSKTLINLEKRMSKDVIGQSEAVSKITDSLFKTHCGLKDEHRPMKLPFLR